MPGVCWIGWYSVVHTHAFMPTVWFWRERREASFFVAIKVTFSSWWSQRWRISWRPDWRAGKWRFESLHYWGTCLVFWVSQQQYASGGDNTGEVQSLTFQDVNPKSGLNWLCLAMSLLMALFWEWGLSSGWKPKIFESGHCSLLGGVILESLKFVSCLGGGCIYCCC
jgi:hypothetical protein